MKEDTSHRERCVQMGLQDRAPRAREHRQPDKELQDMTEYPETHRYTKDHEWAESLPEGVRVGITPYAVAQLGDVTLVDLLEVGTSLQVGDRFGDIESVKTVSELFAPVAGKIVAVNEALENAPEQVNAAPYGDGWMVIIEPEGDASLENTLSAEDYRGYLAGLECD